eukprot:gene9431-1637_t
MTIRQKTEFRNFSVTTGFLERSDGSCEFSQGKSKVVVSVYGPIEVKTKFEKLDKATIEVVFKPKNSQLTSKEKEIERTILSTLEEFILSKLYPRTNITIVIQVLNDDGSMLSVALMGCIFALLDASIPLKSIPIPISCCYEGEKTIQLDPTEEEEKKSETILNFIFDSEKHDLVTCKTKGKISSEEFYYCFKTIKLSIDSIHEFIRKSMK